MTESLCIVDGQTPSAVKMCNTCWASLAADLRAIPDLLVELDVTVTKQAKSSAGGVGFVTGNPEKGLPLNLGASTAGDDLRLKLVGWVESVAKAHTPRHPDGSQDRLTLPEHPLPLARWLLRHSSWVQSFDAANDLHEAITRAVKWVRTAIDRQKDRQCLGQCWALIPVEEGYEGPDELCRAELFVTEGKRDATCKDCGSTWDASGRRGWLLREMEDEFKTAADLSRALAAYVDQAVSPAMIRGYAHRGRLVPQEHDFDDDKPRYRVGDLLDILFATPEKEAS